MRRLVDARGLFSWGARGGGRGRRAHPRANGHTDWHANLAARRSTSGVGRGLAAAGPISFGYLTGTVFAAHAEPMRYAGVTMCLVFLVGLAALPWAPKTKGQPLPE